MDENQTFQSRSGYCGAFAFTFFIAGEWREVVIDDRLPTLEGKLLLFLRSGDRNEFWPSLLEKAFAKIHGSYDSLVGGDLAQAAVVFGALSETFYVQSEHFQGGLDSQYGRERVLEALKLGSLCSAAIHKVPENSDSQALYGLTPGHAYTIIGATATQVVVRNPWGNDTEWKGQKSAPDGEFKMMWKDFFTHFHQVGNRKF
jgi:calpain